jgi:hypothetical protein
MGPTQTTKGAWSGTHKGPRPIKALVLGCIDGGREGGHSFSLGLHTVLFQAEIYTIKACIMENMEKDYTGRNICILSDSQAAIKAIDSYQINSKLVWDCHQSLVKLAEYNSIRVVWVPGHMGNDGNEIADQLARQGSSHPLIGTKPALGISAKVARGVIRPLPDP